MSILLTAEILDMWTAMIQAFIPLLPAMFAISLVFWFTRELLFKE